MQAYNKKMAKKNKAKGLGKLKFYCQMCQKQCRDANGFKCHTMSEGHLRQMEIFRQNPGKMMDEFSNKFENGFINLLSRRWRSKTVNANIVYNEFIHDKEHVHMNSTKWDSLTSFARYLGETGKCTLEESERGLMLRWIDPDIKKQERKERRLKQMKELEIQRKKQQMKEKIERAKQIEAQRQTSRKSNPSNSTIINNDYDSNSNFDVIKVGSKKRKRTTLSSVISNDDHYAVGPKIEMDPAPHGLKTLNGSLVHVNKKDQDPKNVKPMPPIHQGGHRENNKSPAVSIPLSNKPQITKGETNPTKSTPSTPVEETSDAAQNQDFPWLMKGIVVKIMDDKIGGGAFFKKKGHVKKVIDKYGGKIVMSGGEKIIVDQSLLETVIPKAGSANKVAILKGPMRGLSGYVKELLLDEYKGAIEIEGCEGEDRLVKLEYESFSKIFVKKKK